MPKKQAKPKKRVLRKDNQKEFDAMMRVVNERATAEGITPEAYMLGIMRGKYPRVPIVVD